MANGKNGSRELVQATFLFAQLFHTFILTVQGQFVINELQDVYESMWILMKNINFKTIVSYETMKKYCKYRFFLFLLTQLSFADMNLHGTLFHLEFDRCMCYRWEVA